MASPDRLSELECPGCHSKQWIIDCDFRGASLFGGVELKYPERKYTCRRCTRTGTGWTITQQAPKGFLLQPNDCYPMTQVDFDRWLLVLRSNFPEQFRLTARGRELFGPFYPSTPEQIDGDTAACVERIRRANFRLLARFRTRATAEGPKRAG